VYLYYSINSRHLLTLRALSYIAQPYVTRSPLLPSPYVARFPLLPSCHTSPTPHSCPARPNRLSSRHLLSSAPPFLPMPSSQRTPLLLPPPPSESISVVVRLGATPSYGFSQLSLPLPPAPVKREAFSPLEGFRSDAPLLLLLLLLPPLLGRPRQRASPHPVFAAARSSRASTILRSSSRVPWTRHKATVRLDAA
jgi:hypothetical protein